MEMREKIPCWPGWQVVRLIGQGSFGAVYEIQKILPDGKLQKAAMKVISVPKKQEEIQELQERNISNESITEHYRSEMEGIAKEFSTMLDLKGNAHIVYGEELNQAPQANGLGWDLFLRMELLPDTLKKHMNDPYNEERVIRVASDICDALRFCEKKGIIHRDIKPENIFISSAGDYKLGDFGVARFIEGSTVGTLAGTFSYMAPEVYRQEKSNHTLDIYSLGIVLYRMMNDNRSPLVPSDKPIPTSFELERANHSRLSGAPLPPPAHGSEELQKIVLKACAYDRKDRYQSAEEMLAALESLNMDSTVGEIEVLYIQAKRIMEQAQTKEDWQLSARLFKELGNYQDSQDLVEKCLEMAEKYQENIDKTVKKKPVWVLAAVAVLAVCILSGAVWWKFSGTKDQELIAHPADTYKPTTASEPTTASDPAAANEPAATNEPAAASELTTVSTSEAACDHIWTAATCTRPKQCTVCGATEGTALGHSWTAATCTEPKRCAVCMATEGTALGHSWTAATCTEPKRCAVCMATEGTALGHSWTAATCTEPKRCTVCGATEGTALGHSWTAATCTEPKRCAVCMATEGTALGHSWTAATCTTPKSCSVCGLVSGGSLGHSWKNATSKAPQTCIRCGITVGTALVNPFQDLSVGSIFTFGDYEQDGNSRNGSEGIEWIVLDKRSDRILAISRYALDSQRYHYRGESVTWHSSSIRTWLNGVFYQAAFSTDEQDFIISTSIDGGFEGDNVFLLSLNELDSYFSGNSDRLCRATSYAINQNAYVNGSTGGSWWLLRTAGNTSGAHVMSVNSDGSIDYNGGRVESDRGTVRPAVWLSIE